LKQTTPTAWGHNAVAPRAGAWIETYGAGESVMIRICRPPRGGVD